MRSVYQSTHDARASSCACGHLQAISLSLSLKEICKQSHDGSWKAWVQGTQRNLADGDGHMEPGIRDTSLCTPLIRRPPATRGENKSLMSQLWRATQAFGCGRPSLCSEPSSSTLTSGLLRRLTSAGHPCSSRTKMPALHHSSHHDTVGGKRSHLVECNQNIMIQYSYKTRMEI
jgi:hypothetical protein